MSRSILTGRLGARTRWPARRRYITVGIFLATAFAQAFPGLLDVPNIVTIPDI